MTRVCHLATEPGRGWPGLVLPRLESAPVFPLSIRHTLDLAGFRSVRRRVVEAHPAILHAWDPFAARVGWLLTRRRIGIEPKPKLVVSGCDRIEGGWVGHVTNRALVEADRVIAFGPAEADHYRAMGIADSRLVVAPLGIEPAEPTGDPRPSLGLPPGTPYVAVVGRLDATAGTIDAVWAFDVLRHIDPTLRLVIVGDGPERGRIERFARSVAPDDYRVVFAGDRADAASILAGAAVAWVPATRGGTIEVLTALAAGTPVVGFRTPDLAAVIADDETGYLVPPGDRPALSGRTLELLDDRSRHQRVVTAVRAAVRDRFPFPPVASAVSAVYHTLTSQAP
jgi:glycosyltransferase involved in cell wall biosynthesis